MAIKKLFKDLIIFETKNFRVEQDWEVPIPGFFIVSSKRKSNSVLDFTKAELEEFILTVKKIREGMKKVLGIKKVFLIQSEETPHVNFHLWIFPRYKWMTEKKFGKEIISVRPIMHYARKNMVDKKTISKVKNSAEKIRKFFN